MTPLVRYLELPERIRPLAVAPPLRILVVISSRRISRRSMESVSGRDYAPRWASWSSAAWCVLERVPATLTALQDKLRCDSYHMLYFIGHGAYAEQCQDGCCCSKTATVTATA